MAAQPVRSGNNVFLYDFNVVANTESTVFCDVQATTEQGTRYRGPTRTAGERVQSPLMWLSQNCGPRN